MSVRFTRARFSAPAALLSDLAGFYRDRLGLAPVGTTAAGLAVEVGETVLEFHADEGEPFYHFALLAPGDRFEAALDWARARVDLLPERESGAEVFDFTNWDAEALYFHDPAGNIVEVIAHRGVGASGSEGLFDTAELLGLSEVGIVGDPPSLASELERALGLRVWDGTVADDGRLAFVGEKARTVILCRAGRPWLPTGRRGEAHPVELVLAGEPAGRVVFPGGGFIRR